MLRAAWTLSIHLATVLKVCYTFTKLKMDTKFIHIDTEERKWKYYIAAHAATAHR